MDQIVYTHPVKCSIQPADTSYTVCGHFESIIDEATKYESSCP